MWSVVALQVTEPTSEVPDHIRPNHLIKELTKEIRYLEVSKDEEDRIYETVTPTALQTAIYWCWF